MKKLLCLFHLIACGLVLVSCSMPSLPFFGNNTCATHIDNNGDLKCDVCEADVECTSHRDSDEDLKCDKCGAEVTCTHKDQDKDGNCDIDACDYVFCEHEYEDEYSYNKDSHYFLPTCDCNIEPKDKGAHKDADNDGICDVCEWNYNHKHSYQSTWSYDKANHWYEPTCDHDVKKSLAAHADKNNDGICDTCSWDYDHEHKYSQEWSHDETKHWKDVTCGHLIDVKDESNHTDLNKDGICDICSWDYDHVHEYAKGDVWSTDDISHWHAAICGHDVPGIDAESHIDSDKNGECDKCEYNVCGPNHRIDETKWKWNEENHWQPSICGHDTPNCTMEAQGHQWDDEGIVCTMCKYNNGHVHTYDDDTIFESNDDGHWHRYTCHSAYTSPLEPHDDPDNNGICDTCKHQFCNHEFDDTKWAYEEGGTTHWHPTVCTHNVENNKKDEAEHTDTEGKDGKCDICGYQICKHPQSETVYDGDETHHWFDFTECEHEVPAELKTLHTDCDENNDGICDACSYQFCTHPQSETEYSFDLNSHWYTFTECDHVVPESFKTAHDDEDNDGVCTVCGTYCTHPFDTENWASDATNHYHAASCGHKIDPIDVEKHVDTADNNGICDVCQYVMCTHTWQTGDNWTSDETGHWHAVTCGHSVDVIDFAAHVDAVGNDGICDKCNYQICNHTYDTEHGYLTDKNSHWYPIKCGHTLPESAKLPHDDADGDGYCTTCMTQFCTHEYDEDAYVFDETQHWHPTTCKHPVPEAFKQPHVDENNDGFCETCQNQFCVHTEDSKWEYDSNSTHHWKKFSDCEHVDHDTEAAHTDTDGDYKCDVCESKFFGDYDNDVDTSNPIETPPHVITPKQDGEE